MALPRPQEDLEELSDAQLAADAARGHSDALARLYARYARELFAVAYRLLQRREDAEDVVHDVFVGLPEALRRYEERGALRSWLKTLTARIALMRLREEGARPTVEIADQHAATKAGSRDAALTIERA